MTDRDWNLPESEVTDEAAFHARRSLLQAMGFGTLSAAFTGALAGAGALSLPLLAGADEAPKLPGYPAERNPRWADAGRKITPARLPANYQNFYEFSTNKYQVARLARRYTWRPWTVEVGGLVRKPLKLDVDELTRKIGLEERVYRFRCVEAWAMTVPWTGFQLSKLLDLVEPKSEAKYVKLTSVLDKKNLPGQRRVYVKHWPYYEGLSIEEARHELTMIATGIYGKPLPGGHGAPLRLVVPWKYGFKSIKSIVKIELVAERPGTFWSDVSDEYGFWANVNPKVDHARWSQATERLLSTGERIPTQPYNGYEKWVAGLYTELAKSEKLYY